MPAPVQHRFVFLLSILQANQIFFHLLVSLKNSPECVDHKYLVQSRIKKLQVMPLFH